MFCQPNTLLGFCDVHEARQDLAESLPSTESSSFTREKASLSKAAALKPLPPHAREFRTGGSGLILERFWHFQK